MSLLLLLLSLGGFTHPIHSSAAVLELAPGARTAQLQVRVFADDFPPGTDRQAAVLYLQKRFILTDREGSPMPLSLLGTRTDGVVLILTLTAPAPRGLAGARIWHGVLAERFADQVNIVQARYAGRSASLLFTAEDGPKTLP